MSLIMISLKNWHFTGRRAPQIVGFYQNHLIAQEDFNKEICVVSNSWVASTSPFTLSGAAYDSAGKFENFLKIILIYRWQLNTAVLSYLFVMQFVFYCNF
jgi:hypothetical protein